MKTSKGCNIYLFCEPIYLALLDKFSENFFNSIQDCLPGHGEDLAPGGAGCFSGQRTSSGGQHQSTSLLCMCSNTKLICSNCICLREWVFSGQISGLLFKYQTVFVQIPNRICLTELVFLVKELH